MNDDKLLRRLRAADPVPADHPLPSGWRISTLVEDAMTTDLTSPADLGATAGGRPPHRRTWLLVAATVIAAAALSIGTAVALRDDHHAPTATRPVARVLHLTVPAAARPGRPGAGSCIVFSEAILATRPVAFSGTVSSLNGSIALLRVDHWYRGGDATTVQVSNPDTGGGVFEGGIRFTVGKRYLVTAADGVIGFCGYTAEWTPGLAKTFDRAFG